MRGDSGVAGEGRVVGIPDFYHAINEYQLRLDVQRFLWPVYYIVIVNKTFLKHIDIRR